MNRMLNLTIHVEQSPEGVTATVTVNGKQERSWHRDDSDCATLLTTAHEWATDFLAAWPE